jgi:hypothetical protein
MARNARLLALAAPALVAVVAACGGTASAPPHVKSTVQPVERRVALEFVRTAVARKNLARAWDITAPELKHDTTREEWLAGTMRVVPYPVGDKPVLVRAVDSFADAAHFTVTIGGLPFTLGLRNVGGKWLVSTWAPAGEIHPPSGK